MLKFSFSTLGCPGLTWGEMITIAKDLNFDGIEVRGIGNEYFVPKTKPFLPEHIEDTKARLEKLNLKIPCVTSSAFLFDKENSQAAIETAKEYIKLANKLGVQYVRVLGDAEPHETVKIDVNVVEDNLRVLIPFAETHGVVLLIETNGYFANSSNMLSLMKNLNTPFVKVLWDAHHTFRFFGETPESTLKSISSYIEFVHIKDSIIDENGKIKYKMMGKGDVPVEKVITLLYGMGYEGFISLEWVKCWNMELEDPGIVFDHFINYILPFRN